MYLCTATSVLDPLGGDDDVFGMGSLKEKILKRYECQSPLTKGRIYNGLEVDGGNDFLTLTVFLTPPSSPNHSPNQESTSDERDQRLFVNVNDNLTEDDDVLFRPRSTKDLKSMLIRDCMWNGEASNKIGTFEKLRPLTKTPPLVDCNLRITYVDPSEIWPFSLPEQVKAGNRTTEEEVRRNGSSDCADEDVEVDVVGLEGAQKMQEKKEEPSSKSSKVCVEVKCKSESSSCSVEEKPTSPLTPSTSDDEYSCKLRSCIKRRRTSCDETNGENCVEQKMRVSSGDESDQDCELGRASHNVLERKRRNELKQRFQYLRDSIPELSGNDRAPKVAILQKAFSYITYLQKEERSLIEESRKQNNLKEKRLKRILELQNIHSAVF